MGQRDREFNWGGDRREGGRGRSSRERVYRSGDNQEDYSGRGGYTGGDYGDRERGGGYERSRGREHLGEFPRGREDRGRRGYGSREPDMRDMDAFGGYGGRGGGYWGSESESDRGRDFRGQENRNPYYGGGGMFGGGMGGYTGGGYLGGGFGGSAIDNESEEQRAYRRQNYQDRERYEPRPMRGRGGYREDYDDRRGRGEERGFFDRMADTVSSWFEDDDDRYDRREQSYRGRGPRNYTRSDDRIREDINDRLTYDVSIDASDIEVEVNGGEVILSGHVRSRYEKRLAEDIAEDVSGVRNVENRIRVNRESQSWGNASASTGGSMHTGTSGSMTAGSGLGTESTAETGTTGITSNTTSAEQTGTPTDPGTGRGRSAGGTR